MISSRFWNGHRVLVAGDGGRRSKWLSLVLERLNAAVETCPNDPDALNGAVARFAPDVLFCLSGNADAACQAARAAKGLGALVFLDSDEFDADAPERDFYLLGAKLSDCVGASDESGEPMPAVDAAPATHVLDAIYACLVRVQDGVAGRRDFLEFDAPLTSASGWSPVLGPHEALEWEDDLRAAVRRGEDTDAFAGAQADAFLGHCVRLESPLSDQQAEDEPEVLRTRILALVGRYHAVAHKRGGFDANKPSAPVSGRVYEARDMQCLVDSALDFWLTTGRFNAEFEKKIAARIGVKHALTVNSGSSANLVAFSALTSQRLKDRQMLPGDEVITCATGFPTTVNPVLQNNMVPVFVDVDIPTYNATPEAIEAAIGPRTRAVMIAHTLGNPFDVTAIKALCDRHGLFLIEDCCDALGASVGGRQVGTFGDIGTLSFYPAHHITMGEGGAVFTNSANLNKIMESFRDWGRDCYCAPGADDSCHKRFGWKLGDLPKGYDHKYVYSHLGYNLKITDMQAAIGLSQLDSLETFIEARRTNFDRLREGLAALEHVFVLPEATRGTEPSWFGFPLTLRADAPVDRHALMLGLQAANIGTRLLFGGNLVRQPYMKGRNFRISGELANADIVVDRTFWIGVYPGLDANAIGYMIDTLTRLCRGAARAVA